MRSLSKVIKVSQYQIEKHWRELSLPPLTIGNEPDDEEENPVEVSAVPIKESLQDVLDMRAEILREAEKEAEARREAALEEIHRMREEEMGKVNREKEELYRSAREEGFKQGFEEGLKKGIEEGKKRMENVIANAEEVLIRANREAKRMLRESEEELLHFAVYIAEKIIHRELKEKSETYLDIIKGALLHNEEIHEITLKVHPEQYLFLNNQLSTLNEMVSSQTRIIILPDPNIEPYGVVIQSSKGRLDARITSQLEEIRVALLEACRREEEG